MNICFQNIGTKLSVFIYIGMLFYLEVTKLSSNLTSVGSIMAMLVDAPGKIKAVAFMYK